MANLEAQVAIVLAAIDKKDRAGAQDACWTLLQMIDLKDKGQLVPENALFLCQKLKSFRLFDELSCVASWIIENGVATPELRCDYCQSLIELQNFGLAREKLNELILDRNIPPRINSEARGLLGRSYKQKYVSESAMLQDSWQAYFEAFERDPTNYWIGVNLVAVGMRADRDGVSLSNIVDLKRLAADVLTLAKNANDKDESWAIATCAEAYWALGQQDKSLEQYVRYAEKANNAFEVGSSLRQLIEIWGFRPNVRAEQEILAVLKNRLVALAGGSIVITRADRDPVLLQTNTNKALQRAWNGAQPIALKLYEQGVQRCSYVAKVSTKSGRDLGTGFLIPSKRLLDDGNEELLFVTNFHVANKNGTDEGAKIENIQCSFEMHSGLVCEPDRILWESPTNQLDVCVIKLHLTPKIDFEFSIRTGPIDPNIDRCYVIGHPKGRGIELSIADNVIKEVAGQYLRYQTPTEQGSSGSPVFDAQWRLIGVHRAGASSDDATKRLNEGILLSAIKDAIAVAGVVN
jgi:tetratricopeptide (TPR) repeat protein